MTRPFVPGSQALIEVEMVPKHVLVVGKPGDDLKNIDYLLKFTGCRVTAVGDVAEAIDTMIGRKSLFQQLDLILFNNLSLLVQFMDAFNGIIALKRKCPMLVIDKLELKNHFHRMFQPLLEEFDVRVCDRKSCLGELEGILRIRFDPALSTESPCVDGGFESARKEQPWR